MSTLIQSASTLAFAAALAAAPLGATAQDDAAQQAGEAVEDAAQATGQAVEETAEAAGEAADQAAETVEVEVEEAAQETGQAVDEAADETAEAVEGTAAEAAQETEEAAQAIEGETTEVEVEVVEPEDEGEMAASEGEMAEPEGEMAETEEAVQPVEGTIVMQGENSILASDLMDSTVFNAAGDSVGDIEDAIISLDGTVEGVVLGVGGFLGIGEKQVAVELQQISVQADADGEPRLLIDTTRDALENAPEFVTAQEQRAMAQREEQQAEPAADTAPVEGMAPADDATPPAEGDATNQ